MVKNEEIFEKIKKLTGFDIIEIRPALKALDPIGSIIVTGENSSLIQEIVEMTKGQGRGPGPDGLLGNIGMILGEKLRRNQCK
ncbi:MAG: hypothetical protein ACTSXQ_00095 [Alphaproteobacteria bacterium]